MATIDGIPMEDARKSFDVGVTERDIARGLPNPNDCAFALAIKRATGAKKAAVHASRIYVFKDGKCWRYGVPKGMLKQLELFDTTGKLGPGIYTVKPMGPAHALGTAHEATGNGPPRINRSLRRKPEVGR